MCGVYLFAPLTILAFNSLEIPCSEQVIINLVEIDSKDSDSYTVRIDCKELGPVTAIFKLNGYIMHVETSQDASNLTLTDEIIQMEAIFEN